MPQVDDLERKRQPAPAPRFAVGRLLQDFSRWDRAGTGPPKIKIGRKILYDLKKDFGMASKSRSPCNPCEHANLKRQLP